MSMFLEERYLMLLSHRLEKFLEKPNCWTFRCPICGDSKKSQSKRRGFIIRDVEKDRLFFTCKNCGVSKKFTSFLHDFDPDLYRDFRAELFRERGGRLYAKPMPKIEVERPDFGVIEERKKFLCGLDELPKNHPAVVYMLNRLVPEHMLCRVGYTEEVKKLVRCLFGETKYTDDNCFPGDEHEPRLVFGLYTPDGKLVGFQARSIDPNCDKRFRFLTYNQDGGKGFFGVQHLDPTKRVYVVEGCTDSLFLPNCVAVCTSALGRYYNTHDDVVYVSDNEPRNAEIVKIVNGLINNNKSVALLPECYTGMDINDLVLKGGMTPQEAKDLIDSCVVSGVSAKLKFSMWKKV